MRSRSAKSLRAIVRALLGATSVLSCAVTAAAAEHADIVIHGGTVYTGAETPSFVGDVVVTGDKVVDVGPNAGARYQARQVVEARGKIVAPGFIDAHTHPDTYVRSADQTQRLNSPWLFQGVSTVVIGVDGGGTPDIAAENAWFQSHPIGTNLVPYVGFGAVREIVLKHDARAPTPPELDKMRGLVAKGMCEGAVGFSTGLFYDPQSYAKTDEVIALAKEAAKRGGIYDTHQRDESSYTIGLLASVKEAIDIGHEAGMPVHFAHIKALGVDVQGQAPLVIAKIEAARAAGQDVTADEYPWAASGSSLSASLLPRWSTDGGRAALLKRLDDPVQLEKIRSEMHENLRRRGGAESLLLTAANRAWTGKTLAQMAATWNKEPIDAALRIIRTDEQGTSVASFNMIESDIRLFMRQPWVVTGSDGSDGHPRQYATFPMKYVKYVRADKVISLDEFIRSSTGRTADLFKLDRRGYLKAGYFADVVVFDPDRYAPKADYVHPRELSAGVEELLVNGRSTLHAGKLTGEAPGQMLLHTSPAGTCP
jgi:N-acyl-D-amino-acid deacylase